MKEGPTNLIFTTTQTRVHAENETRVLSIYTDDSRNQTKKVMREVAKEPQPVDRAEWIQLQEWLADLPSATVTIRWSLSTNDGISRRMSLLSPALVTHSVYAVPDAASSV